MGMKFFYTFIIFAQTANAFADDSILKYKFDVSTEVYWFNFDHDQTTLTDADKKNDSNDDITTNTVFDFSGRQKKLVYHLKPVNLTKLGIKVSIFDVIDLGFTYGSDRTGFTSKNKVDDTTSTVKAYDSSQLLNISSYFFGLEINYEDFKFNSGHIDVIDVSGDSTGEIGPISETINSSLRFQSIASTVHIGDIISNFYKPDTKTFTSTFLYALWRYLNFSYLSSTIEVPVIPYRFRFSSTRTGSTINDKYTYLSESDLQIMEAKSSKFGFGWNGKYFELMGYFGKNKLKSKNNTDPIQEISTDGLFFKIRGSYMKDYKKSWGILTPSIHLSWFRYGLADETNSASKSNENSSETTTTITEDVTLFGGNFNIYLIKLALDIRF